MEHQQTAHREGDLCMLEIWSRANHCSYWHAGVITGIVSAIDMPYRVNVELEDGRFFAGCSPECVRPRQTEINFTTC